MDEHGAHGTTVTVNFFSTKMRKMESPTTAEKGTCKTEVVNTYLFVHLYPAALDRLKQCFSLAKCSQYRHFRSLGICFKQ